MQTKEPPAPLIILASTSRYRRELMQRLALPFEVESPDVDETPQPGEQPRALSVRLAVQKARVVAARRPHAIVIGCDQVAEVAGAPFGKPGTHERATAQLKFMGGKVVHFHTTVCVVAEARSLEIWESSRIEVSYRAASDEEIERYLAKDRPYDCAGSIRSEGLGISMLDSIANDDPTGLIGLPLIRTCQLLRRAGVSIP